MGDSGGVKEKLENNYYDLPLHFRVKAWVVMVHANGYDCKGQRWRHAGGTTVSGG